MKIRRVVALVGAAAGLSGCTGHAHSTQGEASSLSRDGAVAQIAGADVIAVNATVTATQAAGALRSLTMSDLPKLKQLTASELLARFGQPDFTRREAQAEIWQYRGPICVLDLFLYPDGNDLKVADAITRDRRAIDAPENACMPSASADTPS